MNNGICIDKVNFFTCNCAFGFFGVACENVTNFCSPNPCLNGATCANASCVCADGFMGDLCETGKYILYAALSEA